MTGWPVPTSRNAQWRPAKLLIEIEADAVSKFGQIYDGFRA
jgi:hypothetical protein